MALSTLTERERLLRVLYINSANSSYAVGNIDLYKGFSSEATYSLIHEAVKTNLEGLLSLIQQANSDKNLPNRVILFYYLANILNLNDISDESKHRVTSLVLEICQSDQEFFDFIKYHSKTRLKKSKLSHTVIKAVGKFYNRKSPLELAQSYAKFNRYHKWSHKDLIKLAHVKSDTATKNIVINYILKQTDSDAEPQEAKDIINRIKKSEELRKTSDSLKAVEIITEFDYSIHQVNPDLHQTKDVWTAVLSNMLLKEILPCLGKLYKLGLLKQNSPVHAFLLDIFTNAEKVKASGVHPIDVFSYMKKLEKGGRPIDPKLLHHLQNDKKLSEEELKKAKTRTEAKCPSILTALENCFTLACKNVIPTKKRYLISIDVTEKAMNSHCIGNKTLNCVEAAVSFALVLLKVEEHVTIATYFNDRINIINVHKDISFADLVENVCSKKSSYSLYSSSFEWASKENKLFDVFINFIHHRFRENIPKTEKLSRFQTEPLEKYRESSRLPDAKLVMVCPSSPNFVAAGSQDIPNMIDVLGFDASACKVIECFSRGTFR
ncbi:RNA-binding protein Ro60-like [Cylas formicarius]|uniref:RNA-binding protein Ro60-like n=1 Tax=Cylas formicarius TaxID=197179 RepID=UPI00295835D9|nr:RNA-binding protein Ro60-like [Cylas formicarius]